MCLVLASFSCVIILSKCPSQVKHAYSLQDNSVPVYFAFVVCFSVFVRVLCAVAVEHPGALAAGPLLFFFVACFFSEMQSRTACDIRPGSAVLETQSVI